MVRMRKVVKKLYDTKPIEQEGEKIYELVKEGPVGIAVVEINESKLHYHKKTVEIYYVLDGEGILIIDEEKVLIEKNHLVYIEPLRKHKVKRIGKNLMILVISFPPWSKNDHYLVEKS